MDISALSLSYFNGFNELLSSERTAEERAIGFLKVISLATVIIPLFVGLVYGVNRGIESLRGRVGKKIPSNTNTEGVDQARKTTLSTPEAQRSPRVISFSQAPEVPVLGSQNTLTNEEVTLTETEFIQFINHEGMWTGPENVRIEGDLKLWKYSICYTIKTFPQSLSVGGDLDLRGFEALEALPERLKVGGSFFISHAQNLEGFPEEFDIGRSIDIRECPAWKAIPANLHVHGDLIIWKCPSLTHLPEGVIVDRKLDLHECENLRALRQFQ